MVVLLFSQGNMPARHDTPYPGSVIHGIVVVGVDDGGAPPGGAAGHIGPVVHMHMAVDKVPGAVLVQQIHKAGKALVAQPLHIVDVAGGGVGEEDVKPPVAPEGGGELENAPLHLPLGVHILPRPVSEGTAQP